MTAARATVRRLAAVSFLNAKPLVDGLENEAGIEISTDVPARLPTAIFEGRALAALCPTIDYQRAPCALMILPSGCIGSDGPTFTVRVFSRRPFESLDVVAVDGDSHTSVALLQIVFLELFGRRPRLAKLEPGASPLDARLLIGDKVVRDEPDREVFPFQLDLGEAWKELTGLPFVFAAWMARADADLGNLPSILTRRREANRRRIPQIVATWAEPLGWPAELARRYLADILLFELGPRELKSIELFWTKCHALGLVDRLRPMRLY
ncbi:MAG: menaquinone biosynthesis protein [Acidobacteriota bacterium]